MTWEKLAAAGDVDAIFAAIDQRHKENNVPPIEDIDEVLAEYKARERKRIAEMGLEAYARELDGLFNLP